MSVVDPSLLGRCPSPWSDRVKHLVQLQRLASSLGVQRKAAQDRVTELDAEAMQSLALNVEPPDAGNYLAARQLLPILDQQLAWTKRAIDAARMSLVAIDEAEPLATWLATNMGRDPEAARAIIGLSVWTNRCLPGLRDAVDIAGVSIVKRETVYQLLATETEVSA